MAKTEIYRVVDYKNEIPGVADQINFILNQISNRLDKFEAIRGESLISISRSRRLETSATGTTQVFSGGGSKTLVTLDLGDVVAGDRIEVTALANWAPQNLVATMHDAEIDKSSGTALIEAYHNSSILFDRTYQPGNEYQRQNLSGTLKVTQSGSLTLRLLGRSQTDDGCVGQIYCQVWIGE